MYENWLDDNDILIMSDEEWTKKEVDLVTLNMMVAQNCKWVAFDEIQLLEFTCLSNCLTPLLLKIKLEDIGEEDVKWEKKTRDSTWFKTILIQPLTQPNACLEFKFSIYTKYTINVNTTHSNYQHFTTIAYITTIQT